MHVFRGAGIVLRCPHCDNALVKIVKAETRMWIDFHRHANPGNRPLAGVSLAYGRTTQLLEKP